MIPCHVNIDAYESILDFTSGEHQIGDLHFIPSSETPTDQCGLLFFPMANLDERCGHELLGWWKSFEELHETVTRVVSLRELSGETTDLCWCAIAIKHLSLIEKCLGI